MGQRQQGFTLLELMIAITLSALLSLATLHLVGQMATSQDRIQASAYQVERLGIAKARMEADIMQWVPHRAVTDDFGNRQPAMTYSSDGVLELTRAGWPLALVNTPLRSTLQRVEYRLLDIRDEACRLGLTTEEWDQVDQLTGYCLVRRYRQHVEAERDNLWQEQVVLAPVMDMTIRFNVQDHNGSVEWHTQWPPDRDDRALSVQGVEVTFELASPGTATFFWPVPVQLHERGDD